ncbi:MAG: M1 family metallopeptidase [Gemmatimonadota bacterium]
MLVLLGLLQVASPAVSGPAPYWQQHISYEIDARLDEARGVLGGTEKLIYRNNSPDSLTTFSFHLYLNAFRPGSRWAGVDSVEHNRRFNDLRDPDFASNHVSNVRLMGRAVTPIYPFAPDSTIVRFVLPAPLAPGDSLVAELDWDARPSTVPRRQGRQGRAFDFAQWYPRVVAYDKLGWQEHPLYPAGEFYGDFGDFTVALDVPDDQVVGSTGVALCGDPGWDRANQNPSQPVEYQRDHYPAALASLSSAACSPRAPGRKTIVWRAEDVHHFAMSMRPDYRYEGGKWGGVAVHVLYQPGDEKSWGGGVAVKNTAIALEWLDGLFGKFPWPQITNVHRIEGGGTEFPMMIHDGSPGLGLILHELGHNYLMGILASNEWREGYLDEGFTSFQSTWFYEAHGAPGGFYESNERQILMMDLDQWSEPTSLVSEKYRDFATYGAMIYGRGELFYHQLREIVGEPVMKQILRTYYERWKLKHVDEAAFRAVAEEVSKRDLSAFFGQWLHTTELYDYAVGKVKTKRAGAGWETRVEVLRRGPGMFPVDVVARSKHDSAAVRIDGVADREWVTLVTRERPREVVIDPRVRSHDWNMLNNRATRNLFGWVLRNPKHEFYLDPVFSTRARRDRLTTALLPEVWYNDEGGLTLGMRARQNYLGRFDELVLEPSVSTRRASGSEPSLHGYLGLTNPTWLRIPRATIRFEAFDVEGRSGAGVSFEQQRKGHLTFGPTTHLGYSVNWVATHDMRYLNPAEYENAGTVEGQAWYRSAEQRGAWQVSGKLSLGGGVEYRNGGPGATTAKRYDTQPYFRGSAEATAKRELGGRWHVGFRVFGGLVRGEDDPVRQRWFYVAGADPYQQLRHPLTRSAGSLLRGDDVHFQHPGGGDLRGYDPSLGVTAIAAVTGELERSVVVRPKAKLFRDVRIAAFGDLGYTDGFFTIRQEDHLAADAGIGIRLWHHVGQTTFVTRFDFPIFVLQPDRAIGAGTGSRSDFKLRWVFAVLPAL